MAKQATSFPVHGIAAPPTGCLGKANISQSRPSENSSDSGPDWLPGDRLSTPSLRLSLVMKLLGRRGHRGPTPCPAAEGGAQTGIICLWSPELTQKSLSPYQAMPLAFLPVDLILGFSTIYILNASDTVRSSTKPEGQSTAAAPQNNVFYSSHTVLCLHHPWNTAMATSGLPLSETCQTPPRLERPRRQGVFFFFVDLSCKATVSVTRGVGSGRIKPINESN